MLISDLFTNLSFGELSNLSIGNEGNGTIKDSEQPKIVHYANQALTLIYSRFAHKVDYVNIMLVDGVTEYRLDPVHNVSDTDAGNTAVRFIQDTASDPFTGNFLKIRSVRDVEDLSEDLLLNDTRANLTVKTTSYDTLRIAEPEAGKMLQIEYQMRHSKLAISPVDPSEKIEIFPLLEEALEMKVAQRVFSSMNGEENAAKAARLSQEFSSYLALMDDRDLLQLSSTADHDKLTDRGFV